MVQNLGGCFLFSLGEHLHRFSNGPFFFFHTEVNRCFLFQNASAHVYSSAGKVPEDGAVLKDVDYYNQSHAASHWALQSALLNMTAH